MARRFGDDTVGDFSQGFDQEAACVSLARLCVEKAEKEESLDILKWYFFELGSIALLYDWFNALPPTRKKTLAVLDWGGSSLFSPNSSIIYVEAPLFKISGVPPMNPPFTAPPC